MQDPSYFQWVATSHNTRPAAAFGTAVTPVEDAYGSYAEVFSDAAIIDDVWEIRIRITDAGINTLSRDVIVTVGWDPAGGTSYGATADTRIDHLLCSYAAPYAASGGLGIEYRFPLHIPAGSSIAAKASVNSSDLTPIAVSMLVAGDPVDPTAHWKGAFVRSYGADAANSRGTAVVTGTVAEGAWTELGTLADDIFFWQLGVGADDTTIQSGTAHADLGVGPSDPPARTAILNKRIAGQTAEFYDHGASFPEYCFAESGDKVFARLQHSGAGDTTNAIAYGVGGDGGNTDAGGGLTPPAIGPHFIR